MSQSGGFDMSKMSTAHKILLGAGVLYIIDVFLPWQRVCVDLGLDLPGASGCASASGASGIGVAASPYVPFALADTPGEKA